MLSCPSPTAIVAMSTLPARRSIALVMPEGVRADRLVVQRRAARGRGGGVLGQQLTDAGAGQGLSLPGGEQRIRWLALALGEPLAQDRDGLRRQGRGAPFAAFAFNLDVRAGAEGDVADGERDQFGHAHAGQDRQQQQCVVTSPEPGCAVGCGE